MFDKEATTKPEAEEVVSSLQQSFDEALDRQRALWEEASKVAKDESLRFTKLRLNKTTAALEKFQNDNANPQAILSGQQQWLREMVQDYTEQSLRYSEMLRGLAMNAFSSAVSTGHKAMQEGQVMARAGVSEAEKTADTVRQTNNAMADQAQQTVSRTVQQIDRTMDHNGAADTP